MAEKELLIELTYNAPREEMRQALADAEKIKC